MCLSKTVQSFLQRQLVANGMSRALFSKTSGIPYQTVSDINHGNNAIPSFLTIISIADFFQCHIDEVVGREHYIIYKNNLIKFNKLQPVDISNNLKSFIKNKIDSLSISPYQLGLNIGFSKHALTKLLQKNSSRYSMNSHMIIALADYFDVSIDVMVGRVNN